MPTIIIGDKNWEDSILYRIDPWKILMLGTLAVVGTTISRHCFKKWSSWTRESRNVVARTIQQALKKPRSHITFNAVVFFGTSSAVPVPGHRNVSSMGIIVSSGDIIMVDCGEGTQQQVMQSSVRSSKIKAIFLTHLHGDHFYGIFGLLHSVNISAVRTEPMRIVGPRGVEEVVRTVIDKTGGWTGFPLLFYELEHSVKAETLPFSISGVSVLAIPLSHRIRTYGYIFEELERPGTLDGEKANSLGARGAQLGQLKKGNVVITESGTKIDPKDVLGPPVPGVRIAILQDSDSEKSSALAKEPCMGIDVLIHEATYHDDFREKAHEYGHSTAKMAAEFASSCKAKQLVLTHISCRYRTSPSKDQLDVKLLVDEAQSAFDGEVILAEDFMWLSSKRNKTTGRTSFEPCYKFT
jgi:ribonuclease Z